MNRPHAYLLGLAVHCPSYVQQYRASRFTQHIPLANKIYETLSLLNTTILTFIFVMIEFESLSSKLASYESFTFARTYHVII